MSTDKYLNDIDSDAALEILPQKVAQYRRRVAELAIDLTVLEGIDGHSEAEANGVRTALELARQALTGYLALYDRFAGASETPR